MEHEDPQPLPHLPHTPVDWVALAYADLLVARALVDEKEQILGRAIARLVEAATGGHS